MERGHRLVRSLLGQQVLARNLVADAYPELVHRRFHVFAFKMNPGAKCARSVLPHPPDLPGNGLFKFFRQFNTIGANDNFEQPADSPISLKPPGNCAVSF